MEHFYNKKQGRNTPSPFLLLFSPRTQHSFSDSTKFFSHQRLQLGMQLNGALLVQMPGKTFHKLFLPNIQSNAQTRRSLAVAQDHLTSH